MRTQSPSGRAARPIAPALALGAALAMAVGPMSAAQPGPPEGRMGDVSKTGAVAGYLPLPARAVGVVILDPGAVFAFERRLGPPGAAAFSRGAGRYRWFYVREGPDGKGERLNFGTGPAGAERIAIGGLTLARADTLRGRGIDAPFALVSVEVNEGAGSGPEASFAATDLRVLDGTRDYPLRTAEVVARLEKDDRAGRDPLPAPARTELERARSDAQPLLRQSRTRGRFERSESSRTYVTWLPEPERLRVEIVTRIAEGEYFTGKGTEPMRPGLDPTRPGASDVGLRYGIEYGVELGTVHEVTKAGETATSRPIPPHRFVQRTGPPGGAPPGALPPGAAPGGLRPGSPGPRPKPEP